MLRKVAMAWGTIKVFVASTNIAALVASEPNNVSVQNEQPPHICISITGQHKATMNQQPLKYPPYKYG